MKSFAERKKDKEVKEKTDFLKDTGGQMAVTVKNIKEKPFEKILPYLYLFLGGIGITAEIIFNIGLLPVGISCIIWILLGIWILR